MEISKLPDRVVGNVRIDTEMTWEKNGLTEWKLEVFNIELEHLKNKAAIKNKINEINTQGVDNIFDETGEPIS